MLHAEQRRKLGKKGRKVKYNISQNITGKRVVSSDSSQVVVGIEEGYLLLRRREENLICW
jgi:hypothetical protein